MSFNNTGKHAMLDHVKTLATHLRLYDDDGAEIQWQEASQDKEVTWGNAGAVDDGEVHATSQPVFDIPGGTTVAEIAYINNTGATEYARDVLDVADQETYANDGTYTVQTAKMILTDPT